MRFPELETLVVQPLEYLMTAKELGNNVLRVKGNKVLEQYLTPATIMVVSVTASTTQGTELPPEELEMIGNIDTSRGGEDHRSLILIFKIFAIDLDLLCDLDS